MTPAPSNPEGAFFVLRAADQVPCYHRAGRGKWSRYGPPSRVAALFAPASQSLPSPAILRDNRSTAPRPVRRTSSSSSPTTMDSGPPGPTAIREVETPTLDVSGRIRPAHEQRHQPFTGVFAIEGQFLHRSNAVTARSPRFPLGAPILTATGWTGEVLLPELLQQAGYRTALIGKWHCSATSFEPARGFDRWLSYDQGPEDWPNQYLHNGTVHLSDQGTAISVDGFQLEYLGREAREFIASGDPEQPYFLVFAPTDTHEPIVGHPEDWVERYRSADLDTAPIGETSVFPAAYPAAVAPDDRPRDPGPVLRGGEPSGRRAGQDPQAVETRGESGQHPRHLHLGPRHDGRPPRSDRQIECDDSAEPLRGIDSRADDSELADGPSGGRYHPSTYRSITSTSSRRSSTRRVSNSPKNSKVKSTARDRASFPGSRPGNRVAPLSLHRTRQCSTDQRRPLQVGPALPAARPAIR